VVQTGTAATRTPRGSGQDLNRTVLLWEEEDISKLG